MSEKERQEYLNTKEFRDHIISTTTDLNSLQKAYFKLGSESREDEIKQLKHNIDQLQNKIESLLNE